MQQPDADQRLFLTIPGYRRWLTPDMLELRVQIRGFDAHELEAAAMHVTVNDADNNPIVTKSFVIDDPVEFVMPAPKVHGAAEILMMVEDSRTEKILTEARWRVTSIDPGGYSRSAYFDFRKVLIANREAVFPRVCRMTPFPNDAEPKPAIGSIVKMGFNTFSLGGDAITLHAIRSWADAAVSQECHLLVSPLPARDVWDAGARSLDAVYERVRALRNQPGILGYELSPTAAQIESGTFMAIYRTVRRSDSARFVAVHVPENTSLSALEGFEDVAIVGAKDEDRIHHAERLGLPVLGAIDVPKAQAGTVDEAAMRYGLYRQLVSGVSGLVWTTGRESFSSTATMRSVQEARALDELLRRGEAIAWPPTRLARNAFQKQGLRLWQRRFNDVYVLVALHDAGTQRTFTIPVPPPIKKLAVLAEGREMEAKGGMITDEFAGTSVHVYTNHGDLASRVPQLP